jgi:catechol 2,3-dioxygenase-like lactoylglutathione lyase family enzyme
MAVKRIVANIATGDPAHADAFYAGILGLELAMDHGWIRTYAGEASSRAQISFASEGGSGSAVPDLSIEVDDIDAVIERVRQAGIAFEYGPADEPWGVRRFYVRDPFGRLLNILMHHGGQA